MEPGGYGEDERRKRGNRVENAPPASFKKPRIDIETKLAEGERDRGEITRANRA